jgi:hypothetical protein
MVFSAYGQERTVSWETRVVESFNGDDDAPYLWRTQASRFTAVVRDSDGQPVQDSNGNDTRYPLLTFVDAFPVAGFRTAGTTNTIRSLGLRGQFDRRGYNWVDLFPVSASNPDGGAVEIPIPGKVNNIDCWVWGSNLRFYIEIFLRDYRGVVHTLKLGDISYAGWRNLRVMVPTSIPQERRILPSHAGLSFVKFRIWTLPVERVDNFFIYFKQLRVLTDVYEYLFDGSELADPDFVEGLWAN